MENVIVAKCYHFCSIINLTKDRICNCDLRLLVSILLEKSFQPQSSDVAHGTREDAHLPRENQGYSSFCAFAEAVPSVEKAVLHFCVWPSPFLTFWASSVVFIPMKPLQTGCSTSSCGPTAPVGPYVPALWDHGWHSSS